MTTRPVHARGRRKSTGKRGAPTGIPFKKSRLISFRNAPAAGVLRKFKSVLRFAPRFFVQAWIYVGRGSCLEGLYSARALRRLYHRPNFSIFPLYPAELKLKQFSTDFLKRVLKSSIRLLFDYILHVHPFHRSQLNKTRISTIVTYRLFRSSFLLLLIR